MNTQQILLYTKYGAQFGGSFPQSLSTKFVSEKWWWAVFQFIRYRVQITKLFNQSIHFLGFNQKVHKPINFEVLKTTTLLLIPFSILYVVLKRVMLDLMAFIFGFGINLGTQVGLINVS